MDIKEYRKLTKGNKYKAIKTVYKGEVFDSGAEAWVAQTLDLMRKDKKRKVVKIERQPKFVLKIKGTRIGTYRADFRVTYKSGEALMREVIDVKSAYLSKQSAWRFRKKVIQACTGVIINEWIVNYRKGEPYLVEIKID